MSERKRGRAGEREKKKICCYFYREGLPSTRPCQRGRVSLLLTGFNPLAATLCIAARRNLLTTCFLWGIFVTFARQDSTVGIFFTARFRCHLRCTLSVVARRVFCRCCRVQSPIFLLKIFFSDFTSIRVFCVFLFFGCVFFVVVYFEVIR